MAVIVLPIVVQSFIDTSPLTLCVALRAEMMRDSSTRLDADAS